MAAFPVVNGVEGIAEYLPARHYSVLASCLGAITLLWTGAWGAWEAYPGTARHSTTQHITA